MILAIDTCQDQCALALRACDGHTFASVEALQTGQAERVFPLLTQLLAQAGCTLRDITQIGVTVGPGNFTGIRVGVCAAIGLGLSREVPVFGVTTLSAWAQTAYLQSVRGDVDITLDARKGQVYAQVFHLTDTGITAQTDPIICTSTGHKGIIGQDIAALSPQAICDLVIRGHTVPVEPFYLRKPDAVAAF